MFELIFFIIVIAIVVNSKKKKIENNNKTSESYRQDKNFNGITRAGTNNSSYYSKQKIEQYRQQERNHYNHEDTEDISNTIGYKRCPQCENLINKKSETCFMCDYNFKEEETKKTSENQ